MFEGKIRAALKMIEQNSDSGVLPTSDDVIQKLQEKHPQKTTAHLDSLLKVPIEPASSAHFACINEAFMHKAALYTKGAGGPCQLDAIQFKRILCSNHFKVDGKELRDEIAAFALKIATEVIDPTCLEAYSACRLIPLNKNPGIRPIGVGEVLRRIH